MSIADLYFVPNQQQDEAILYELTQQYPEEGEAIMELMPAWKRWGYEEGLEKGLEKGIEKGIERGIEEGMETTRLKVARKLLDKGFSFEEIGETIDLPAEEVRKLVK